MNARDFCFWLQGLFELAKPEALTVEQTELVKRHLGMVFVHDIDPSFPAGVQEALTAIHEGKTTAEKPPTPAFQRPTCLDHLQVRC